MSLLRPLRRLGERWGEAAMARVTGTITHVTTDDPVIALTFDDGPHPAWTPRLLDVLAAHRAVATFFMIGEAARRHPELVRRVADAGHAIGNHSWDHPSFPLIASRERRAQILACGQGIAPYGRRLFRPPYGHQSMTSRLDPFWLGYQVVTWSVNSDDWRNRDAASMARQLVGQVRPGDIIVFHDGLFDALEDEYFDRQPTVDAVRLLLDGLGDRVAYVTIPELLRHGTPKTAGRFRRADPALLTRLKRQTGATRRYGYNTRVSGGRRASTDLTSES